MSAQLCLSPLSGSQRIVIKNTSIEVDQAPMTQCRRRSQSTPPTNHNRPRPSLDDDPGSIEKESTLCAQSWSAIKAQGMEDHTTDAGSITPRSLEDDEAVAPSMSESDTCGPMGAMDESALDAIRSTALLERMDISLTNSSNTLAPFSVKNTFLCLDVNAIVPSLVRSKSAPVNEGRSVNESDMAECLTIGAMEGRATTEAVQCTIAHQTSIGLHLHEFVPFMYGEMPTFAAGNQPFGCSAMDADFHAIAYGSMPSYLPNNSWFDGLLDLPPSQYGQYVDSQQPHLLSNGSQPQWANVAPTFEETETHRIHEVQLASLVVLPHAFKPQTVMRFACESSGVCCIRWTVDAKKLRGHDRVAVSPSFELSDSSLGASLPFKMIITPKMSGVGKGGGSFRMANGQGMIQLKCEAPRDDLASSPLTFWLSVGGGRGSEAFQVPRGPVQHNFAQSGMRGLPKDLDIWDFNGLLDTTSQTFVVCLTVLRPWH